MEFTVYILRCADGSYYTGLTRRPVEERVWEHNAGMVKRYTDSRRPVELMCIETTVSAWEAIDRERQIKGWSKAKKEALIAQNFEALQALSRNRQSEEPTRF